MIVNSIVEQKRKELMTFIEQEVIDEPTVQAIVVIGSIATGLARPDSDIDAVVFLDPFNQYAIPAEFQWLPTDGSFHSIFVDLEDAIQFDFKRFALTEWSKPTFDWPEPLKAELHDGWIAFDRCQVVSQLLAERTTFTDKIRIKKLDEALLQLDQLLTDNKAQRAWANLGPLIAHDRLHAAYDYLIQAFFAYNRKWRPWRNREMSYLLQLPWLPQQLNDRILSALNAPSLDYAGFCARLATLTELFNELTEQLIERKEYGQDIISEAFIRQYDELGRSWNIEEWVRVHKQHKLIKK